VCGRSVRSTGQNLRKVWSRGEGDPGNLKLGKGGTPKKNVREGCARAGERWNMKEGKKKKVLNWVPDLGWGKSC